MNKRTLIALIIIFILSWLSYQGYENKYFFRIPFYAKHLINFGLLAAVAVTGLYGLSNQSQKWMQGVWLLSYAVVILLMIITGLSDLYFRFEISSFRDMVHTLRMFFSSPVPFAFLLFINHKLKKKNS